MTDPTFADRLAAVHDFPCVYTFKLIGAAAALSEETVHDAVAAVVPGAEATIGRRASSGGRYTSLTVEVPVPDVEAVLALYERFRSIDGLTHML